MPKKLLHVMDVAKKKKKKKKRIDKEICKVLQIYKGKKHILDLSSVLELCFRVSSKSFW